MTMIMHNECPNLSTSEQKQGTKQTSSKRTSNVKINGNEKDNNHFMLVTIFSGVSKY